MKGKKKKKKRLGASNATSSMTQNGPMGQCFMEANGLLAEVTVGQRNRGRLSLWCQIRWVLPASDGLDAVGGVGIHGFGCRCTYPYLLGLY